MKTTTRNTSSNTALFAMGQFLVGILVSVAWSVVCTDGSDMGAMGLEVQGKPYHSKCLVCGLSFVNSHATLTLRIRHSCLQDSVHEASSTW